MSSRGEDALKLKDICETHNLSYGIFWEDRGGICSVSSFFSDEEKARQLKSKGQPVYTEWSTQITFPAGEGYGPECPFPTYPTTTARALYHPHRPC
mmetsp:Transcript_2330/g.8170  ORF Transcript_2330/g.8170 Transcript_2330/m.8170 type:complete len:96 (+) Transcript_2330:189-476(+)